MIGYIEGKLLQKYEDRILILADLKDLSEENGQLEAEIVRLVEERAYNEQALASYEAVLADSGF